MKHLLILLLLSYGLAGAASAQEGGGFLAGQRQPAVVSILPQYERYTYEDVSLSQLSATALAFVPIRRDLAVSLRAGYANAQMEGGTSLSGLTDVTASLSHSREVGSGSVVLGLTATLPSGRQRFEEAEFNELRLFGLDYYGFRVPGFGQGTSIAPSLTYALPVSESVVLGAGVSWVYRGAFEPLANMADKYDPGDEVLLTGGFDWALGASTRAALDLTYAIYSTDQVGSDEVFDPGNKLIAAAQLRRTMGAREFWLFGRYRSRGENFYNAAGALVAEPETSTPDRFDLRARYTLPLGSAVRLGILAEALLLQKTRDFPTTLIDAGLAPEFRLSRSITLPMRFAYRFGDMTGLEAGLGLTATL